MTHTRFGCWVVGVAIVLLFIGRVSLSAIGPMYIVIHGGELQAPLVIRPAIGALVFMWGGGTPHYDTQQKASRPTDLEGRRYLSYDVYWGWFTPDELKPTQASQHGRLYLPRANQPAAVILTFPNMASPEPTETRARPALIPTETKDFVFGRAITPVETAALVAAGVPLN